MLYLDHAATAYPRSPAVIQAVTESLNIAGSAGRGAHAGATQGQSITANCRSGLAELLGADDPDRIVLYPSATCALNTLLCEFAQNAGSDGRLLISPHEHNAVWRPAIRHFGHERVDWLPIEPSGVVDLERLRDLETDATVAVFCQHASNVSGVIQPIEEIGRWCEERGLPLVVDGAQAGGLVPFEVGRVPALVSYTIAGHKFLGGPPGIGVAYYASHFNPEPLWIGGNGVDSASERVPEEGPARYESGTSNTPAIAGLAAAVRELNREGLKLRWEQSERVTQAWRDALAEQCFENLEWVDPFKGQKGRQTLVFALKVDDPPRWAKALEERFGIRCRAGYHCAPLAHQTLSTFESGGTLRVAPGLDSDETDIQLFVDRVRELERSSP